MKKAVACTVLAVIGTWALAKDTPRQTVTTIHGQGGFEFREGDHGEGYASFLFNIQRQGPGYTGSLLFAAEYELDFPDIVVELDNIQYTNIGANTVRFAGIGLLIEQPVFVTVLAVDNERILKPDTFELKLISMEGEEILHAHGPLFIGNIQFGEPH
jgi:hypothetical protein